MKTLLPTKRSELIENLCKPAPHGAMGQNSAPEINAEEGQKIWKTIQPFTEKQMLYVHVPFCVSRCMFCGFYQNRTESGQLTRYSELLLKELEMMKNLPAFSGAFDTVYFGGGTPTDLPASDLFKLISTVRNQLNLTDDAEFTIEGRLFGFDDEKVQACLDAGANRFSFGVQTFDTKLRQSVGRRLPREEIIARLNRIKELGENNASVVVDLIYGFPGQTLENWMENIHTVNNEVPLDGVDLYLLKMLPGTPISEKFGTVPWTTEELILRQKTAGDYLTEMGWDRLSVTHWGRGGLEKNRYNHQSKIGIDIVPVGSGAGGFIGDHAFMQMMSLEDYQTQIEAGQKPVGAISKRARNPIRNCVVNQMELRHFEPKSIDVDIQDLLDNWSEAGIWEKDEEGVYRFTELGDFFQTQLTPRLTAHIMMKSGKADGIA